jgi:hypothetical protein
MSQLPLDRLDMLQLQLSDSFSILRPAYRGMVEAFSSFTALHSHFFQAFTSLAAFPDL